MSENTTVKAFGAVEAGKVFDIPLECIGTYNVRKVLPRLPEGMTYEKVIRLALGSPEQKAEMVRLVNEHEAETLRLNPKAHTIIMLAESILDNGQLQAIVVRQTGTVNRRDTDGNVIGEEKRYGYMVVLGGRRTLATAYLYALDLIAEPVVLGRQMKMTKEEAFDMSVAENFQRADMTEREIGECIVAYRERGMTWPQVVEKMRRSEPTLRAAYLIVRPEAPDAPTDLAEQVEAGTLTKGQAVQIATGQAPLGDGGQRLFRTVRKTISVKSIEALIDATPRDEAGMIRITAFAETLGSTVDAEVKASDERLAKVAAKADTEGKKAEAEANKAKAQEIKEQIANLKAKQKALENGETITTTVVEVVEEAA